MITLKQKIDIAMILKGIQINELAEQLGITRGYLSPIINGRVTGKKPELILEEVKDILEIDDLVVCYQKDFSKQKQEA